MNDQRQNSLDNEPLVPSRHGTPGERPRRSYLPLERRTGGGRTYLSGERRGGLRHEGAGEERDGSAQTPGKHRSAGSDGD